MCFCLNTRAALTTSSIPLQKKSFGDTAGWLMKNASWLQNALSSSFFPLWIHSAAALEPPPASLWCLQCRVFHFNSSHSTTGRENNVMYNFQCVSHLMPASIPQCCLSPRGDTSSCEAEPERFYPTESATSPRAASSGEAIWCTGNTNLIQKNENALPDANVAYSLHGGGSFSHWRRKLFRKLFQNLNLIIG